MSQPLHSVTVESLEQRTLLSTFMVTTTNDSGRGSLRQAINNSNGHSGADQIKFNIPGGGVHVITPLSQLPAIGDAVTINGYTQPGAAENTLSQGTNAKLLIELNGAKAGAGSIGLDVEGSPTTIRGLIVNGWAGDGILIGNATAQIAGNFIGTDAAGAHAVANGEGVDMIVPTSAHIGGTAKADVNLLSGNGIGVGDNPTNNTNSAIVIEGNLIGTDASGHHSLPNSTGVLMKGIHIRVGGTTSAARNIISGNRVGIFASNAPVAGFAGGQFLIEGNFIGTDVSGAKKLGNGIGVEVHGCHSITVGATGRGARNVISGNNTGVRLIFSTECIVIGNLIGTDASGVKPLGNASDGVLIQTDLSLSDNSQRNLIGGVNAGEGNIIAYNRKSGVGVTIPKKHPGTVNEFNAIRGNKIFSNKGLGIDLRDDGVTPNDHGDGDTGPNNLQNFPIITSATRLLSSIVIKGTLDSKPGTSYLIDVYASDLIGASGQAQADINLGSIKVTTNASGLAIFSKTFAAPSSAVYVTATATTLAGAPAGDTSELAAAVLARKVVGRSLF